MRMELATAFLRGMLTDKRLKKKQPTWLLIDIGKRQFGLTRAELKSARKELGVVSENIEGIWYWALPEERT